MVYLTKEAFSVLLLVLVTTVECTVFRPHRHRTKRPRPTNSPISKVSCNTNIRNGLDSRAPVFFKNGQLEVPSGGEFKWYQGENVGVLCSDPKNKLITTRRSQDTIDCYDGTRFTVGGKREPISKIKCQYKTTGDVEITSQSCAGSGTLMHVGFRSNLKFLNLYESCVDENKTAVLYTHHTLYGSEIKSKSISQRVDFKSEGFPKTSQPRTAYNTEVQIQRLATLLNSTKSVAKTYLNSSSNLQRGHLTPDGDMLLNTWQWATYFYINVAPMWKSINTGSWKKLENTVRNFASNNRLTVDVYTGTDGILEIQGVPVTLDSSNGIPVPQWLWKIVKHQNEAIVFVISNNPFQADNFPCGNTTVNYNWSRAGLTGEVAFCSVADARPHIRTIPGTIFAPNVLHYR
ncbi:uncharacterized protein LOC128733813 [Sabethes cyaneus]|uniref:uncharacterized protein LOC128733813 n=1 Tax=Sabethes cyaneus TaxID=53552 RepID=UPI00237DB99E|nr:uncharacterized protein LOC128733813 [Sabethes cyaneus]